jgi:hypothetical protein
MFLWAVLMRPWGGVKRLFGLYPAVRGAVAGLIVAALLAGLLDGAGLNVAGAAAAMAIPLVTLAAIRALSHADDRTVVPVPAEPAAAPVTVVEIDAPGMVPGAPGADDRPAAPGPPDLQPA